MIPPAVKLKVKYGLRGDPTDREIAAWTADVVRRTTAGEEPEEAGRTAAFAHFKDVDECFYGSEADNIEALLKALAAKG